MSEIQTATQIDSVAREKRSPKSDLKEALKRKNCALILRIEAPLGIVGKPGSGRKTLAYRFANMDRDDIEDGEVPVAYSYTAVFEDKFSPKHSDNPYEKYQLRLTSYIIDPPAELPDHNPPLYWEDWNKFCCLIFVFDVTNQESFHSASMRLTKYRQDDYRLPEFLVLVGNKCDRRNDPPNLEDPDDLNQRPVSEWTAYMESEHLGASYFECSAKNNTDVHILMNFIRIFAIGKKYWIGGT